MKTLATILIAVFALFLCMGESRAACTATIPFTLQNGQVADANQVMANFNSIVSGMQGSCAGSGVNSDITGLIGGPFPPLLPGNNLSDVGNFQTSLNNLKIGCPSGNGPNTTTKGQIIAVFASCFGVVTDGVTDDTTAWNAAITYANAHAGTAIVANPGTSLITSLNGITANNTQFICVSGPGTCIISHSGNNAFVWGTSTLGGGMYGIQIQNRGAGCNVSIFIHGAAQQLFFEQVYLGSAVGTLATLGGTGAGDEAGSTTWQLNTSSGVANNVACPFFNVVNGFGLFIKKSYIFTAGASIAGRNFINADIAGPVGVNQGSWDTLVIQDSFFQYFSRFLKSAFTGTGQLLNTTIENNLILNCQDSCFNTSGTGIFSITKIEGNSIDGGTVGQAIGIIGNSQVQIFNFSGNTGGVTTAHGILIGGNGVGSITRGINVQNNFIYLINGNNIAGTYGILVQGDANAGLMTNINVQNNQIPDLTGLLGGHTPVNGIAVQSAVAGGAGVANVIITGNQAIGGTNNYVLPTPVQSGRVSDNLNLATTTSSPAVGASPATYTAGLRPESVYLFGGGGITDVKVEGLTVCNAGPCYVQIEPLKSAVITYGGGAPTAAVLAHQ